MIREYISGARAVPAWLAGELTALVAQFPGGHVEVDPRRSIEILQQQMIAAGYSEGQAAAGILGAAYPTPGRIWATPRRWR